MSKENKSNTKLIAVSLILIAIAIIITSVLSNVNEIAEAYLELKFFNNYPVLYAMSDSYTDDKDMLAMQYLFDTKNIKTECAFNGLEFQDVNDFYHYETKRLLEKEDLTCVDQYKYSHVNYHDTAKERVKTNLWATNRECVSMGFKMLDDNVKEEYFKCPLKNCKMREVQKKVLVPKPSVDTIESSNGLTLIKKGSANCKFEIGK